MGALQYDKYRGKRVKDRLAVRALPDIFRDDSAPIRLNSGSSFSVIEQKRTEFLLDNQSGNVRSYILLMIHVPCREILEQRNGGRLNPLA